jgi:hypothetical protein
MSPDTLAMLTLMGFGWLLFALVPIVIGGLRDMKGGFGVIVLLIIAGVLCVVLSPVVGLVLWLVCVVWTCIAPTKKAEKTAAKRHAELLATVSGKSPQQAAIDAFVKHASRQS